MSDLLSQLEELGEDDALEKLHKEVDSLKENQQKFAKLVAAYIKSNDSKMDRVLTSIEILQNKAPSIHVEGGKGGSATGGNVDADIG